MEIGSNYKSGKFKFLLGWLLFGVCLISLLVYSLSFFISEPTVETITTGATDLPNSNNGNLIRDVKLKSNSHRR